MRKFFRQNGLVTTIPWQQYLSRTAGLQFSILFIWANIRCIACLENLVNCRPTEANRIDFVFMLLSTTDGKDSTFRSLHTFSANPIEKSDDGPNWEFCQLNGYYTYKVVSPTFNCQQTCLLVVVINRKRVFLLVNCCKHCGKQKATWEIENLKPK